MTGLYGLDVICNPFGAISCVAKVRWVSFLLVTYIFLWMHFKGEEMFGAAEVILEGMRRMRVREG